MIDRTRGNANPGAGKQLRIAAIQMVSEKNLEVNLEAVDCLVAEAVQQGAEMVVLPENFAVFGQREFRCYGEAEATPEGPLRSYLQRLARRHNIWLVGGTIPTTEPHPQLGSPLSDNRVYPACFVYNPQGEEVARYDKIHLFDVDVGDRQGRYRESDSFQHGGYPGIVSTPWGNIGIAVCYDIRFPEYFRLLMDRGAQLVVIPSAFTYITGEAHWQILLRARAIENLCFTLGACQGGWHDNNRQTWGGSAIVNPWGKILDQREQGEGVVIADLDFSEVDQARARMPVHGHRHFHVSD